MISNDLISLLLSWVKTNDHIDNTNKNKKNTKEKLEKLEEKLLKNGITKLAIIHQSTDYYTLRFLKEGHPGIKQFSVEEVKGSN